MPVFECDECHKKFASRFSMDRHEQTKHNDNDSVTDLSEMEESIHTSFSSESEIASSSDEHDRLSNSDDMMLMTRLVLKRLTCLFLKTATRMITIMMLQPLMI